MKFSDLKADVIAQKELVEIFGGAGDNTQYDRACDTKACSKRVSVVQGFCTNGDGICRYNVA